ncbi:MAG: hypothetical protein ACXVA2_02145 [Mucilaginibacter sp.]
MIFVIGVLFSFTIKAQDKSLDNFIKKEGYVRFTDTSHLPSTIKSNYCIIEKFFIKQHFDKNNYYVLLSSIKKDGNILTLFIRQTEGLKILKKRNGRPIVGGVATDDGTLSINLKSRSVNFYGEE